MAAEILDGDLLEVRFINGLEQQVAVNVRHWKVTAITPPGIDLQEFADAMSTRFAPHYKALMPITALYRGCGVRRLSPAPTLESLSAALAGPGLQAGDPLPGQIAGLIKLVTDTPGPKGRGRCYVPFPSEASNAVTGQPDSAYVSLLDTLGFEFWGGMTILAPVSGAATIFGHLVKKPILTSIQLTGHINRDTWATQRRRRIGVSGDTPPI